MIKCYLPLLLVKMIHTQLLIVLLVTLRSIYRKQAIVTTHKQSLKRSQRTKKTNWKTSKPNNSCNIKQFLTVPKLCVFGLIRKFRSRASICKKNQLKRSYKTQVMIKRSSNSNLLEFKFQTFKNMFKLFYWIEGIITKKWALVSLDLD